VAHRYAAVTQHLRTLRFDGIVDGGANVGEFALIVRRALPEADLVCVEPQPDCAEILRRRGFRVVPRALWDSEGTLALSQVGPSLTSCTVEEAGTSARRTWTVPAVRLDQLEITGSNLLIKLDLQGSELTALRGMGELWPRCTGFLLEVSFGADGTYQALSSVLAERGFREYSTVNEMFVNGRVAEADKLWLRSTLLERLFAESR
jgi:FkbM family methyltransferase